jgi:hypothetical protein
MQGNNDEALAYSSDAVAYLERIGTMPALRTEEVLWNHVCVLQAMGLDADAHPYLERAYTILQRKAGTIHDNERRRGFHERVSLNRSIVTAATSS